MLTKLTPQQEALIPEWRERYRSVGLSTTPVDRGRAVGAMRNFYTALGHKPPRLALWFDSPFQMQLAWNLLRLATKGQLRDQLWDQLADQLRAQLRDQLWDQLEAQLGAQLRAQLRAQLADQLRDQLRAQLADQLWDQLEAQLGAQLWDQLEDQLRAQLEAQLWDQLEAQLGAQLWDQLEAQLGAQLRAQLGAQLADQLRAQLGAQLGAQLADQLRAQLGAQLADQLRAQLWGQLKKKAKVAYCWYGGADGYWIAFDLFIQEVLKVGVAKGLKEIAEYSENGGWCIPEKDILFLSDRPSQLHFDEDQRLHNDTGPACQFRDGWSVYAVHGARIPPWVFEEPEKLTVKAIQDETNAEIRRVMVDRYGPDRYLADCHAAVIHTDSSGRLLQVPMGDDEPLMMVEVVNSTAESDGSLKKYHLRVPPSMRSAREAVAWTFGMNEVDYQPEVET